ncbi:MAG: lipid-binding SYLF domain-containing protein [Candidatus Aceula meridiana]|nr:lipid-binding SYLF domain-containing protein [Candidatus Aceula meridiana]
MKKTIVFILILTFIFGFSSLALAGWKESPHKKEMLLKESNLAIQNFKYADPEIERFFERAYGWAIFPTVGKAAFGIGGAYGEGLVYEKKETIGHASLTQLSFGFQAGGQGYSEIIFFKDSDTLSQFKQGNFKLGATASAAIVTLGASMDADFNEGLAIFTLVKGGLMVEASAAGQKFKYWNY